MQRQVIKGELYVRTFANGRVHWVGPVDEKIAELIENLVSVERELAVEEFKLSLRKLLGVEECSCG